MRGRTRIGTAALVVQLALVGTMLGSLHSVSLADKNVLVASGLLAGAFVGFRTSRASSAWSLFGWSLLIGALCGFLAFAPFAWRSGDNALFLSGPSIGVFLSVPMFILALPAFFARNRPARARHGSIVGRADVVATWAASGVSIAILGSLGQPVVALGGRAVNCSVPVLAISVVAGLVAVGLDARALWALVRYVRPSVAPSVERAGGKPSDPTDVGLGEESLELRVPASNPFRSAERVVAVNVGSVPAGRRAVVVSLLLDVGSAALCALALVHRMGVR